MGDVMDKKSGRMNVSAYSAIQTVKYSWAAKASKISKKQEVFKYFTVKTNLKSPVLKNVVTKIRNSKKTYVGKLKNLENSSSATSSSTRVTKKAVLKTAAEVETALKTKLVSEREQTSTWEISNYRDQQPTTEKMPRNPWRNHPDKKNKDITF